MPSFIVVEDSLTFRYLIKDTVKKLGYELIAAVDNINSAIQYLKAGKVPDVVLLDVVLPGEPGTKLIEYIKANNTTIRIILTTALNDEQVMKIVTPGTYDDIIQKPFTAEQLSKTINTLLSNIASPQPAPRYAPQQQPQYPPQQPQPQYAPQQPQPQYPPQQPPQQQPMPQPQQPDPQVPPPGPEKTGG